MKIVLGELLGWEGNEQKRLGLFGKLCAFAAGVEEQGRTSLHGHIELWIKNYCILQQQLFSKDADVRLATIAELGKYLETVLSGSFEITSEELLNNLHPAENQCSGRSL
jgi:hypothetical protein